MYNRDNQEKTLIFQGFHEFRPSPEIEIFYGLEGIRVPGEVEMASWILLD